MRRRGARVGHRRNRSGLAERRTRPGGQSRIRCPVASQKELSIAIPASTTRLSWGCDRTPCGSLHAGAFTLRSSLLRTWYASPSASPCNERLPAARYGVDADFISVARGGVACKHHARLTRLDHLLHDDRHAGRAEASRDDDDKQSPAHGNTRPRRFGWPPGRPPDRGHRARFRTFRRRSAVENLRPPRRIARRRESPLQICAPCAASMAWRMSLGHSSRRIKSRNSAATRNASSPCDRDRRSSSSSPSPAGC